MKRFVLSLALLSSIALPATAAAQSAPTSCQFVLGFKTLHDLDAKDIGDCTDGQAFAANGDALQHTANGLMAWRKADNWTAFTNGYMTWINGPDGLVNRLNTDRFPWEKEAPPAAAPVTAPPVSASSAPAVAAPASGPAADVSGGWRLQNNQALYRISEEADGYVTMVPNDMRSCTPSGQAAIPAGADLSKVKSPMNVVFTGAMTGNVIDGNWLVCATVNQSWVPQPIKFTLSTDGQHLTGQLQETLTLDRV